MRLAAIKICFIGAATSFGWLLYWALRSAETPLQSWVSLTGAMVACLVGGTFLINDEIVRNRAELVSRRFFPY